MRLGECPPEKRCRFISTTVTLAGKVLPEDTWAICQGSITEYHPDCPVVVQTDDPETGKKQLHLVAADALISYDTHGPVVAQLSL